MNHPEAVEDFLNRLEHPLKAAIQALRVVILEADPRIKEEIKWNAPSFFVQAHFATFKLRPLETVQVVLHTGVKVKDNPKLEITDDAGLLKWVTKDRCLVTFSSLDHINRYRASFKTILKEWLEQTAQLS